MDVTSFRKRVFTDIIKNLEIRSSLSYLGWTLNPMTNLITDRREDTEEKGN